MPKHNLVFIGNDGFSLVNFCVKDLENHIQQVKPKMADIELTKPLMKLLKKINIVAYLTNRKEAINNSNVTRYLKEHFDTQERVLVGKFWCQKVSKSGQKKVPCFR